MDIELLQKMSAQVRRDVVRMVYNAKSGHIGGSLGCTDLLTYLFFEEMRINPDKFTMTGKDEDLFILSNGHISPVYYSILSHRGYFPIKELSTFRQFGSRLQGHPSTHSKIPGVRFATGSLGQGLSVAVGAAIAKKMDGDNHFVYVLTGDGELEEGQNWEAVMLANARGVDNLIAIVDNNGVQIDGTTESVCGLTKIEEKFAAFGWEVLSMDGHNFVNIQNSFNTAKQLSNKGKPVVIVMKTEMGHGVDYMINNYKWHGSVPNEDLFNTAMSQLPETLEDY